MENKEYIKDVLLQKKYYDYTNKEGELVKMAECYSRTEKPFDESGYFVKHFYTTADKIQNVEIGDVITVKFSKMYKKFYLG